MPRFRVEEGDITTYTGDAIVNAANNHLVLGAGVAGAIGAAGGPTIQEECSAHGPIKVGEAAITGAGELHVDHVIHAAAMGDVPVSDDSIRDSTLAAVALAAQYDVKRIAFPVLGTGVGGFGFDRAAVIMRDALQSSPDAEAIDEIVFFGFRPEQATTLRRLLQP